MPYQQTTLTLPAYSRGIHIITPQINQAIDKLISRDTKIGLVHLFLQHTSASLAINENADPDVRLDTEWRIRTRYLARKLFVRAPRLFRWRRTA